jgi:hypothetical protein
MTRGFLRFLRGNTIALIALFLALGGTTYAAVSLPANSVGAKQLKKNAVINKKIKANAVTGGKVKNDSLTGADVVEGSLGTVPSATNATNATNAANATNATNATTATNAANATNASKLGGYAAGELTRVGSASNPGDHSIGAGNSLDVISTTLTVPKKSNVLVIASGYSFASATGCPCILQGHLRQDSEAISNSTTLVTSTNLAGDAGDTFDGFDRRAFSGSRVFVATPGTHTFKYTMVRQTGTSTTMGTSYLHLTAVLLPFGNTGIAPTAPVGGVRAAAAPTAR